MSKPVDQVSFWKQRIADSKKYGDIHHSVYISPQSLWNEIERAHKNILEPYKDKKVLDAGCGYARLASFFSNYTGVDLSPDLLAIARENHPDKTLVEAKLENLPFEDKEFDMAFCISIKGMVVANLGQEAWEPMEKELLRVAKEVLILEYETSEEFTVLH